MSCYDSLWETGKGIVVIVVGIVLVVILIVGAVMAIGRQAEMPASLAKIEQLRSDAAHVDPAQAEDVIGQVTVWNQTIRENQALNATWWAGWLIPDEWDAIELMTSAGTSSDDRMGGHPGRGGVEREYPLGRNDAPLPREAGAGDRTEGRSQEVSGRRITWTGSNWR